MLKHILVILFFLEAFCRLDHALKYGFFNPLSKEGYIFYNKPTQLAYLRSNTPILLAQKAKPCEILISGSSLMANYSNEAVDFKKLIFSNYQKDICLKGEAGISLELEIQKLLELEHSPKKILFISGFNDLANIKQFEAETKKRQSYLMAFLKYSLFLQKLLKLYFLNQSTCQDLELSILKNAFLKLKARFLKTEIVFIRQPVNSQYLINNPCFFKRQAALVKLLKELDIAYSELNLEEQYFFDACHLSKEGYLNLVYKLRSLAE